MQPMDRTSRTPWLALALGLAALVAACGDAVPSSKATDRPAATAAASPDLTPVPTAAPTAVPATIPANEPPEPSPGGGTTETAWGTILDLVPDGFPVLPGASPVEVPDGPSSGAWMAGATVEEVARWYADALSAAGYEVDLGSALEDGGRIMDVRTDLPECRIQVAFRPAGESTIITVLYGAGCAGGGG
jgi:hypothetical protein